MSKKYKNETPAENIIRWNRYERRVKRIAIATAGTATIIVVAYVSAFSGTYTAIREIAREVLKAEKLEKELQELISLESAE